MRYFTIEQREALRERLEALIGQLRGEVARGPLANHHEETDDDAVADLETSLEVAESERASAELEDAMKALERLHAPDYGACTDCGVDIPYTRLLANPAATRCIACQRTRERSAPAAARL